MGRPREAPLDDLAALRMGVRVDREGKLSRDYQTATGFIRASGKKAEGETVLSDRFYLADASFLVGLEGPLAFLEVLAGALNKPVWQICLGRKAFTPSVPVLVGIEEGNLEEALSKHPIGANSSKPSEKIRLVLEVDSGEGEPRMDQPVSFTLGARQFSQRHVRNQFITAPSNPSDNREVACT
jgi:CRISPR system Cascade subunit CasD